MRHNPSSLSPASLSSHSPASVWLGLSGYKYERAVYLTIFQCVREQ